MLKDLAFSWVRAPANDFITTVLRLALALIKGKLAPDNGEGLLSTTDGVIFEVGNLGVGGFLNEE